MLRSSSWYVTVFLISYVTLFSCLTMYLICNSMKNWVEKANVDSLRIILFNLYDFLLH